MTWTEVLPWLAAGAALGAAYLALIGRSVAAIADGGDRLAVAVLLLLRMGLAVGAFLFAARHGALPVLSMLAGFHLARSLGLRRARVG